MQSTQHSNTRCPVYLLPSACGSPAAVKAIQHHTGLPVITPLKGRTEAVQSVDTAAADASTWPFRGDAA
ncbi:hypothetical protein PS903_03012 [Pseudomonas fluorescens]|nr:hypothetical protein PS903_03012 [Pseudomonas fluorescens]